MGSSLKTIESEMYIKILLLFYTFTINRHRKKILIIIVRS